MYICIYYFFVGITKSHSKDFVIPTLSFDVSVFSLESIFSSAVMDNLNDIPRFQFLVIITLLSISTFYSAMWSVVSDQLPNLV